MLRKINFVLRKFGYQITEFKRADIEYIIISYPKAGRTWLRLLLGKVFAEYVGIKAEMDLDKLLYLHGFSEYFPGIIPSIGYGHAGGADNLKPSEINPVKKELKNFKVILLVRDPRDILVSYYYSRTKRVSGKAYKKSISKFIYEKKGGFDTILQYYNIWAQNRDFPKDFLLIKYEDLHKNTFEELKKVLKFIKLDHIDNKTINKAIEFASFNSMRKMEENKGTKSIALRPVNPEDKESYKTRKGIIGDFRNHFTKEEIDYLNKKMKNNFDPYYAYNDY